MPLKREGVFQLILQMDGGCVSVDVRCLADGGTMYSSCEFALAIMDVENLGPPHERPVWIWVSWWTSVFGERYTVA